MAAMAWLGGALVWVLCLAFLAGVLGLIYGVLAAVARCTRVTLAATTAALLRAYSALS